MNQIHLLRNGWNSLDRQTRLRWGYAVIAALALAVLLSLASDRIALLEKKRLRREADLVEMMALKSRIIEARTASQRLTNRLAAAQGSDSPARIIEDIGIKGKSGRITPMKGEERGGFVEDAAEVKIDGLTANEAVNLLHRLEKGPRPVIVRKALIRTRFDDPSRLDLTLTVALLRPAPATR
ncbi:MAG: general secretion pathway protein GspM [Desulfuromonadales bacterium]|nr:MAG: general secretion pathway protein GspM [Desulfuromonadales bacterium]